MHRTSLDDRISRCRIGLQKVTLTKSLKKILVNHARINSPNESSAILFGVNNNDNAIVKEVYLAENIEKSPVRFTISNEQLIDAYRTAERKKMDVIAIFHSHPASSAVPSSTDKKFMKVNPVVWIIYSVSAEEFRSYVLDNEVQEILTEFL